MWYTAKSLRRVFYWEGNWIFYVKYFIWFISTALIEVVVQKQDNKGTIRTPQGSCSDFICYSDISHARPLFGRLIPVYVAYIVLNWVIDFVIRSQCDVHVCFYFALMKMCDVWRHFWVFRIIRVRMALALETLWCVDCCSFLMSIAYLIQRPFQ